MARALFTDIKNGQIKFEKFALKTCQGSFRWLWPFFFLEEELCMKMLKFKG